MVGVRLQELQGGLECGASEEAIHLSICLSICPSICSHPHAPSDTSPQRSTAMARARQRIQSHPQLWGRSDGRLLPLAEGSQPDKLSLF